MKVSYCISAAMLVASSMLLDLLTAAGVAAMIFSVVFWERGQSLREVAEHERRVEVQTRLRQESLNARSSAISFGRKTSPGKKTTRPPDVKR